MQLSVLKNLRSDLLSMALLISETLLVNNKGGKMIIIRGRTVMLYFRIMRQGCKAQSNKPKTKNTNKHLS